LLRISNYDYDVAVQKEPDGSFLSLVLKCTHAGQPLTKTGSNYYCTLHGSQFNHEGKVLKGPASHDLTRLKSVIDKDYLLIYLEQV
jgi:Rieske Fe-S protein